MTDERCQACQCGGSSKASIKCVLYPEDLGRMEVEDQVEDTDPISMEWVCLAAVPVLW